MKESTPTGQLVSLEHNACPEMLPKVPREEEAATLNARTSKKGFPVESTEETLALKGNMKQHSNHPPSCLKVPSITTKPKAPPKEVETYTFDRSAAVTPQSWAKFEDLRGMDAMEQYASTFFKIKETYKLLGPARLNLPQQAADWSLLDLLATIKDSLIKSDYAKYTWTK
jgi:hypothetical protein